jgi:hypothetical protein
MLKVLGDGGVGRGVKDHDSGDRGGGRKKPLLYFRACHDVEGNFLFLSFLISFFLLCLSYFLTLHPVHPLTFQTQHPFLEVARRAALRRDAATIKPKTFSLDPVAKQVGRLAMGNCAERERERLQPNAEVSFILLHN